MSRPRGFTLIEMLVAAPADADLGGDDVKSGAPDVALDRRPHGEL